MGNISGNISETRKDRVKVTMDSPTLFRTAQSPTPYGLPFLEIGGLLLSYPLLSQKQIKLRTSNFVGTFIGSIGAKAHEKCWEYSSIVIVEYSSIVRESRKFSGHPCIGHIAIIASLSIAIAELSCI